MVIPLYNGFYLAVHFPTGLARDGKRDRSDEVRGLVHATLNEFHEGSGNAVLISNGERDVYLFRAGASDSWNANQAKERAERRLKSLGYVNRVELKTRQELQAPGGVCA